MLKKIKWQVVLGLILVLVSAALYLIHYLIFRDARHIFIYFIGDLAFIPFEILLVTLIIHKMLNMREKKALLEKLNMIIGAFFSEIGAALLAELSKLDPGIEEIRTGLKVKENWTNTEFNEVLKNLTTYSCSLKACRTDFISLKKLLTNKRDFMVRLLENQNILEHEMFTDLLWSVFHLTEELADRENFEKITEKDKSHLEGDINRAYGLLIRQWIEYMKHLKTAYPYLFSLAMRQNPFDLQTSPYVI